MNKILTEGEINEKIDDLFARMNAELRKTWEKRDEKNRGKSKGAGIYQEISSVSNGYKLRNLLQMATDT